jgi:hypothetical protein
MICKYGEVLEYPIQNWCTVITGTYATELQKVKVQLSACLINPLKPSGYYVYHLL